MPSSRNPSEYGSSNRQHQKSHILHQKKLAEKERSQVQEDKIRNMNSVYSPNETEVAKIVEYLNGNPERIGRVAMALLAINAAVADAVVNPIKKPGQD